MNLGIFYRFVVENKGTTQKKNQKNSLLMKWNHVNYQKQLHSNEWKSVSDEFINSRFFFELLIEFTVACLM